MYASREEYRAAWDGAYQNDPAIPLNVDIELASACNARCPFCLYGDRDWTASMAEKDWDGAAKRRFMPKEMACAIIDECAAIGVPALKMNFRGESTLHRDYGEIMRYAAGKKVFYGSFGYGGYSEQPAFHEILVNTNGNCPPKSVDGLMAATKVMVSLDSLVPETYATMRAGLDLGEAIKTIDELVARKHPDLWVRRVVCTENAHEDFVGAVRARWPTGLKVSEHHAFDRNHYQNLATHGEDVSGWERTFCGYPAQRVVVEASGRYAPCCITWSGELDSGMRFPQDSILTYWRSEFRKKLAAELRANVFTNEKCRKCTSFMSFKRPERDFVKDVEGVAKLG